MYPFIILFIARAKSGTVEETVDAARPRPRSGAGTRAGAGARTRTRGGLRSLGSGSGFRGLGSQGLLEGVDSWLQQTRLAGGVGVDRHGVAPELHRARHGLLSEQLAEQRDQRCSKARGVLPGIDTWKKTACGMTGRIRATRCNISQRTPTVLLGQETRVVQHARCGGLLLSLWL